MVLVFLSACGSSSKKTSATTPATKPSKTVQTAGGSGGASGNTVEIKGFAFGPASLKTTAGTKVTWTNKDSVDHTVTADKSDPASFDSGHLSGGKTFSFTFAKPGTYKYFCNIHNYMKATITVS